LQINHRPFAKPKLGLEGLFLANLIDSGINAQTSVNQGSAGYFPSKDLFQFGLGSALPRTMFLHFNRRPNEGSKWSTIYLQKSTIYLQFALQLNRRLRGRGAHFWSTIYLQSTLAVVSVDSFLAPALIARAGPRTRKKFFEFFTVPIRNAKREPPTSGQSSSSWLGSSAPAISTLKTLSPSRSRLTSKPYSARLRRPRSNSTWPPSGCCFPGSRKKESWP